MAVEEGPDDPAIQDPAERLMVGRGSPLRDELLGILVGPEAADSEAQRVGRPAPEAAAVANRSWRLRSDGPVIGGSIAAFPRER